MRIVTLGGTIERFISDGNPCLLKIDTPENSVIMKVPMDRAHILIVDDETPMHDILSDVLEAHGHHCTTAADSKIAIDRLNEREYELLLCDINMPGMSGLELVQYVRGKYPRTAIVMVTGLDSPELATVAISNGAYGYILKPFETNEVLINVANALRRRRLEIENEAHRTQLEAVISARTAALHQAIEHLERTQKELRLSQEETIRRLSIAAEYRDESTAQHIQRMSHFAALLARLHGLPADRCELIRLASPMHDIGKIGTPDNVLLKAGKFTPEEFKAISLHPEVGYRILAGSQSELLQVAATIAHTHHEKYDGTGYPRGLKGQDIPLEGRIVAIADNFDALTTKRVYKPAYSVETAVDIMRSGRGKDFDPALLDRFLDAMDEVVSIMRAFND